MFIVILKQIIKDVWFVSISVPPVDKAVTVVSFADLVQFIQT